MGMSQFGSQLHLMYAFMLVSLLANATVSTGFVVLAYLAISVCVLFLLVGLFEPGPRYRIDTADPEDNTSDSFLHTLECLTDSRVHRDTVLTVLTNGDQYYEDELRAIASAQQSVNLEAYIFQRGEIATRYLDALTERARAGIGVNVLMDALGSAGTTAHYLPR